MRAVSIGFTIPIPTSLIVWNQNRQCPGIIMIQCPGIIIIQCPGIIMSWETVPRFPGILLTRFPVLPGIIPASQFQVLLLPVILYMRILAQCPGLIQRIPVPTRCLTVLNALPRPLRKGGPKKGRIERRARERENRYSSFIHDARWANQRTAVPGSPVVPVRPSRSLRPSTPYLPCRRQCTRLPGL